MSFLKKRKKKSISTLTLNSNSNNSNIVCVNNSNNNNNNNSNINSHGINLIINKKIKKLSSSTSCPNMLTIKEEENEKYNNNNNSDNNNNNNNNLKDTIIINWNKYTDKLIKQGYLECGILDLDSGELNSSSSCNSSVGFILSYQEWQEIKNILQGSYLTTISCSKKRFYVVASNDFIIAGRDSQNQSFILRKTQTKAIIGIFNMNKLQIDDAHKLLNDLYYEIIKDDKTEIYPVE
ncbi:hypothetical protein ACTFIW_005838 [Dictyostelium discoideum]